MRKIVDYGIVEDDSLKGLRDLVRIAMKEGWQPLGGAFMSAGDGSYRTSYAQTMIKYGEGE